MEDSYFRKPAAFSLPPGCRFHPSEEHLFLHYLTNKNSNKISNPLDEGASHGYDLIRELNLHDYDPFELPDVSCFPYGREGRKRHWYCYTIRVMDGRGARRRRRRMTKGGYWKRRGKVRNVIPHGTNVLGTRTSFVFYLGTSAKSAVKTDWLMYEYALNDRPEASFVLCRVFVCSVPGNSTSENGLSSCAEESISALGNFGKVRERMFKTGSNEARPEGENSVYRKNDTLRHALVQSSVAGTIGPSFAKTAPAEHLLSVLEGNFIELDDLVD